MTEVKSMLKSGAEEKSMLKNGAEEKSIVENEVESKKPNRKAIVKSADMSEEMQEEAIQCASQALDIHAVEKDVAAYIKKEFDKRHAPTWHCIVGRNFGSYVTHETKHFIYFYLDQMAVLLFKSG
ncbi:uncharacterized protein LOC131049918 [Cryptomeria japonica]|uniref:uncharacterized protein LOC131049918 n=1 Tax=Cryptomeria japonica TaxID=3369 RepID=UPI0025AB7EAA|nr:uncharacterized protein LOC131049918 [Cryptomeria japonica]XP_057839992.1 uncharacterized protein LOC131049918 [Cryptomeria japonica]XP_057839993.1 uncharacterized protein LOC131049918 [Cryptomeria japonica]XP_057839994.1 uncharacterized protein LOC131049918 [Cryptomeria japonica]XP_057839995.1 uncharacterized protein LOC131049918 [Cryptomeria japonica]